MSVPMVSEEDGEKTERKDEWSSIPVLVLWMIMDKLDIFDNKRLPAVCRDWRSASNGYPKVLQSVGDGLPWISGAASQTSMWEFCSVARDHTFKVHMPGCADHRVVFSKQGWMLMQKSNSLQNLPDSLFLANPFTGEKIELPPDPRRGWCHGRFTTNSDGYPQRVFLLRFQNGCSTAIIKTACPGDKEWTDHTLSGDEQCTKFFSVPYFLTIGQFVYWVDNRPRVMAFNLSDDSWKVLPSLPSRQPLGFITEHEDSLFYVEHVYDSEVNTRYSFTSSFALFRYDDSASSWTRMSNNDVRDTSWFSFRYGCIATTGKEKGLKIYHLRQDKDFFHLNDGCGSTWVEVYDLLTGKREIQPVPFRINCAARWVDIG